MKRLRSAVTSKKGKQILGVALGVGIAAGVLLQKCGKEDALAVCANPTELEGSWSRCGPESGGGSGAVSLIFFCLKTSFVQSQYDAADCAGPARLTQTLGFEFIKSEPMQGMEGVKALDFVVRTAKVRPVTQAAADSLNAQNTCGSNQWQPGIETDVYAIPGYETAEHCLPYKKDATYYTIYKLDGGNKVYFGDGTPGATPATRTTTLETTFYQKM